MISRRDIQERAERRFHLWGPNSGGGEDLYMLGRRIFLIAYRDAARSPDDGGYEVHEIERAAFLASYGARPEHAEAMAYVRSLGDS